MPAFRIGRSGVFALFLRLGVHGFERHHTGNAGGGNGAAVVGKAWRERCACQVRGPADTDRCNGPASNPAVVGGVAFGGVAGELVIA